MEKRISIQRISDPLRWDTFVDSSRQGSVFSSSVWIVTAAEIHGGNPVFLGAFDGNELIAGVGYVEITRGPLKKATSPLLSPYSGFMYGPFPEADVADTPSDRLLCAEKLIHYLASNYHATLITHAPGFADVRPFSWGGWDERVRYTYLVDIADGPPHPKQFRDRVRRKIARAAKTIIVGSDLVPEHVGELHEQLYHRKHMTPPVTGEAVALMVRRLTDKGLIEIRTALTKDNEIAAFQANVIGRDTVYTWVYGSTDDTLGADAYLIHDAVERYSGTFRYLDLVGANIPSIAFFKRGFGGTLTPYYATEHYSSGTAKLAFATYTRLKRLIHR